jgi:hypothetical protein
VFGSVRSYRHPPGSAQLQHPTRHREVVVVRDPGRDERSGPEFTREPNKIPRTLTERQGGYVVLRLDIHFMSQKGKGDPALRNAGYYMMSDASFLFLASRLGRF